MASFIKLRSLLLASAAPLLFTGCQAPVTAVSEASPHYIAMASTVAKLRQVPCDAPATQAEQARLAQSDPMVMVGGALHAWVPPHAFPPYLQAMQKTLHCDSEQWVAQFQKHLAYSDEFAQVRLANRKDDQ